MELLTEEYKKQYLERMRVFNSQTLFPPNWPALLLFKCPLCGNKLKLSRRGVYLCNGKKHGEQFIITKKRMEAILKQHDIPL